MSGKLIVLEGIDGSGKSSQYRRICEKLNRDHYDYYHIVFPRYEKESSALIRMYLNGEFGMHPEDVNAYTASTFYAVDRFASFRDDWGKKYNAGELIFSDRYTTSNAVHQGCKLHETELDAYFSWLKDLEYQKMQLPEPDLVLYLDVSLEIAAKRRSERELSGNSVADIHEKDQEYLAKCLNTASRACDFFHWIRIPYLDTMGRERELEDKNEEIYGIIKNFLNDRQ